MRCDSRDLTIDEALNDPVIAVAMRADRVDPRRFEELLRSTARRIGHDRRSSSLLARICSTAGCATEGARASW